MIAAPTLTARVNLKPLASDAVLERIDPGWILRRIHREMLKSIKTRIMSGAFSKRARDRLSRGLRAKLGPSSVTFYTKDSAFMPLVMGQRAGAMTWLLGARAPVPIVLDDGQVIFRTPTARSMRSGGWRHPGRAPTTIIEMARQEARKVMQKRIQKEIARQIRSGLKAVK